MLILSSRIPRESLVDLMFLNDIFSSFQCFPKIHRVYTIYYRSFVGLFAEWKSLGPNLSWTHGPFENLQVKKNMLHPTC